MVCCSYGCGVGGRAVRCGGGGRVGEWASGRVQGTTEREGTTPYSPSATFQRAHIQLATPCSHRQSSAHPSPPSQRTRQPPPRQTSIQAPPSRVLVNQTRTKAVRSELLGSQDTRLSGSANLDWRRQSVQEVPVPQRWIQGGNVRPTARPVVAARCLAPHFGTRSPQIVNGMWRGVMAWERGAGPEE